MSKTNKITCYEYFKLKNCLFELISFKGKLGNVFRSQSISVDTQCKHCGNQAFDVVGNTAGMVRCSYCYYSFDPTTDKVLNYKVLNPFLPKTAKLSVQEEAGKKAEELLKDKKLVPQPVVSLTDKQKKEALKVLAAQEEEYLSTQENTAKNKKHATFKKDDKSDEETEKDKPKKKIIVKEDQVDIDEEAKHKVDKSRPKRIDLKKLAEDKDFIIESARRIAEDKPIDTKRLDKLVVHGEKPLKDIDAEDSDEEDEKPAKKSKQSKTTKADLIKLVKENDERLRKAMEEHQKESQRILSLLELL